MTKRVLLICPKFFGYEHRISDAFVTLGWKVDFIDERPSNKVIFKVFQRLNLKFITIPIVKKYYQERLKLFCENDYDLIFFVNIESVDETILEFFNSIFPQVKRVLYMWDSTTNKSNFSKLLHFFDHSFSFDPKDCSEHSLLEYLPLFYSKDNELCKITNKNIDISFIGTVHADRLKIVESLKKQAENSSFNFYVYYYYPNRYLYFLRCIFDKNIPFFSYRKVNFIPLTYDKYYSTICRSRYVIDINHPGQTGLTMRTIEVVGTGTRVLSTNQYIIGTDLHKNNMIKYINRNNPLLPNDLGYTQARKHNEFFINNWLSSILTISGLFDDK